MAKRRTPPAPAFTHGFQPPRGHGGADLTQDATATARWLSLAEVGDGFTFRPGQSLFLGAVRDEAGRLRVLGREARDDRHGMTVAGSRAGKGTSFIVPNLKLWPGSVIANDPKGELAQLTADDRRRAGQSVAVLDPFDETKRGETAAINPLDLLKGDEADMMDDAGLLADALIIQESGSGQHFTMAARNLLHGLILAVSSFYEPGEKDRSLIEVRRLLTESAESGRLAGRARMMMEDAGGFAAQAAASIEAKGEAEGSSVLSTAQEQTTFLASPGMARALSKSSVELDELKTSAAGLSIYLVLPARRLATHSRFMRLILTAALGRMEAVPNISTRSATATGFPVLFMLDEFAALGHMEIIEKAAGLMAGYGVKLWTVLQDLTQLKRHYKEGWETFLGNCGIMQFFGNTDATTCEYVSKLLGETETMTESFPELQIQQQAQGMEGRSRALTTAPLLRPDEVARSFARSTGRQLVISPDHRPLVCERIAYHDSNFTDLTRGR